MPEALCPNCKSPVRKARPVRIPTEVDDKRWKGRQPEGLGFACQQCGVLLPLMAPSERDEAP